MKATWHFVGGSRAGLRFGFRPSRWSALSVAGVMLVLGATAANADLSPIPNHQITSFVRHDGSALTVNGAAFRFAGANIYWLGLDDNIRDASGQPTYPTQFRIDNALAAAQAMGVTVVRSQTLGISVGNPQSIEPSLNSFNDAAFAPIDYAVADAAKRGIYLDIPLTDEWRFYHGGKSVFTGWRGYPNNPDLSQNAGNNAAQKASEAHFFTDPTVISDFETYIAHILNHRNPMTGLLLKDSPNIMSWETGNELFDAPPAWTETIASFIKSQDDQQLVSDGSASSGAHVADHGVQSRSVDIVGGHFYPRDPAWMKADAAVAAAAGKAYVVGEYDWVNPATDGSSLPTWLNDIAADPDVSGAAFWSLLPQEESGADEPHSDGYALWSPGVNPQMTTAIALMTTFAREMQLSAALQTVPGSPEPGPPLPIPPIIAPSVLVPPVLVPTPQSPIQTSPVQPTAAVTTSPPSPASPATSTTSTPLSPAPATPSAPAAATGEPSDTADQSCGPLSSDSWQAWSQAQAQALSSPSGGLCLETADQPVTVMSTTAPRHDGTVAATLTPATAGGVTSMVVDASSSGPSMGTDNALVAVVDASNGTVQVLRHGNSPLTLSPALVIPGFTAGAPVRLSLSFEGTTVRLSAATAAGRVLWSGTETTLTGNGNSGFVQSGSGSAVTISNIAFTG